MRTTLSIDDDVLAAVQELARSERRTAGQVLSDLARGALTARVAESAHRVRNGFPVLASAGTPVTNALIDQLREEEGV